MIFALKASKVTRFVKIIKYHWKMMRFFYSLMLILCCCGAAAQEGNPFFRHYSTDQGLPSPEVYEILQDSKGFLWFGTDNGVSRFDGYSFRNFSFEDGLRNNVVFHLQEDEKGRIWMGTMSGNLYYYEKDSIYAYPYNHVLDQFRKQFHSTSGILIQNDTVYIGLYRYSIIEIYPDGTYHIPFKKGPFRMEMVDTGDKMLSCPRWKPDGITKPIYHEPIVWDFRSHTKSFSRELPIFEVPTKDSRCIKTDDHYIINFRGDFLGYDHDGNFKFRKKNLEEMAEFSTDKSGAIYMGLSFKKGIKIFRDTDAFQRDEHLSLFHGYSITDALRDRAGGYWFSSLENGVFYCPNISYRVYTQDFGFSNPNIKALTRKDAASLFVASDGGEVLEIQNGPTPTVSQLPSINEPEINDMIYDASQNRLWIGGVGLRYLHQEAWQYIPDSSTYCGYIVASKRLQISRDAQYFWGCYSQGFLQIDNQSLTIDYYSSKKGINQRTLCFYEDLQGRQWVGNVTGLYQVVDQQLIPPEFEHPLFPIRVEDLAGLKDGSMVIATKGGGILIWHDSSFVHINQKRGLTSNMVECLFIDEKQHIWAGTLNGLNKITYNPANDSVRVENYTIAHGLPSNEINDICVLDDQVWVATSRGLALLGEDYSEEAINTPLLQSIRVNNETIDQEHSGHQFGHQQNNLQFHFLTLNYRLHGKIVYRYRLARQEKWNTTTNTSVNFPKLSPGKYAFEVQSQDENGAWGRPLVLEFEIMQPFWQHWVFWLGMALLALGLAFVFYRRRVAQIQKEANLEREVNQLKQSALQAQMNPHFVFNCLNAIQNFIATDEKLKASHYLARFAKLVRATLHISMERTITLEEDMNILENYLELEKIRFKNRFEYSIKCDSTIIPFDQEVPPLLLQPYVENAIIHGLVGNIKVGKIDIRYYREDDYLVMEVRDNGIGISKSKEAKAQTGNLHKSVGMSISRKRLELITTKSSTSFVEVEDVKNEYGEINGTSARLYLNINKKEYQNSVISPHKK